MKKVAIRCVFFALFLSFFALAASAEEVDLTTQSDRLLPLWQSFAEGLPSELAELLPKDLFTADLTTLEGAIQEAASAPTLLSVLARLCGISLHESLQLLARLCGILLIGAIFKNLGKGADGGLGRALSLCGTLCMLILIFSMQRDRFLQISAFLRDLHTLSASTLPLSGALYAMGGNVGAAMANHSVMTVFLAILQQGVVNSILPVAAICLALSLSDAVSGQGRLAPLCALIKRTYTLGLSFLMVLLCGVLGIQSTLAKGSDTLALRSFRFAAGSFLPVIGGSISEALRTVSGSVQYLRTLFGSGVILIFVWLFLPTFVAVIQTRIAFMLAGAVAKLLGCNGEERILTELSAVYGYFLAVIAALFAMTLFSLTLLARCAVAGGGL